MSIASESLSHNLKSRIQAAERDARAIAKEHGIKVRRDPINGIDVQYADGKKMRYYGWFHLRDELVKAYNVVRNK